MTSGTAKCGNDAAAGKFAALNREADNAQAAGQTRPLNDVLHEP